MCICSVYLHLVFNHLYCLQAMRDYLLTDDEDALLRIFNLIVNHKKRGDYAVGLKMQSRNRSITYDVAVYDKQAKQFVKQESVLTNILDAESIIEETLKELKAL